MSIFTRDGTLESYFKIRWYDRSVELDTFLIGIEFLDMLENNRELIDKTMAGFQAAGGSGFGFVPTIARSL